MSKSAIYSLHTICCLHIKHLEQYLSHPYQLVSTLTDIFSTNAAFDKQLQCTQYTLHAHEIAKISGISYNDYLDSSNIQRKKYPPAIIPNGLAELA